MAGRGNSRQLNQETAKFLELIENLELEGMVVTRMGFELFHPLEEGPIVVAVDGKTELPSLQEQRLEVSPAFTVTVTQKEEERLRFQVRYNLVFSVRDRNAVSEALGSERVLALFRERQIPKLVWPFLRADFHLACSKLGIHPIMLKLLR